ncbi:hypothetical protein HPB47_019347, partial [Ixodes persulcatus]
PKISPFSFSTNVTVGERGTAICTATVGDQPLTFRWLKNGRGLTDEKKSVIVTDNADFSVLKLPSLSLESSGNYTCIVSNLFGSASHSATLRVHVSPKITPFSFASKLVSGQRATVICSTFEGDRPLTFAWLKDGSTLSKHNNVEWNEEKGYSTLNISPLSLQDSGNYTCVVSNSAGSDSLSSSLVVHVQTKIMPFTFPKTLLIGERLSIICTTMAGAKPLGFTWLKDGKPLRKGGDVNIASSPEFSTLSIENLELTDAGNYTCTVSSSAETVSYTDTLQVKAPPVWLTEPKDTYVTAGHQVTIPCKGEGFPPPSTAWTKLESQHHVRWQRTSSALCQVDERRTKTIELASASKPDQGSYTCEIANGIGEAIRRTITILVKCIFTKSYFHNACFHASTPVCRSLDGISAQHHLENGGICSVICTISVGDTPIQFAWLKDGSALSNSSPNVRIVDSAEFSTLHIAPLALNSAGNYTCSVSNKAGYTSYTAPLVVQEKPKLQPLHFPQSRIRVGESASALCALVAGSPVVRFKWFKENVAIDGTLLHVNVKNDKRVSVLTIESVTLSSAGNYTCIADNDYGSDANSAALVVEAPPEWKTEPRDLSVSAGQALLVECSATGYPVPKVIPFLLFSGPKNEQTLVASQDGSATLSVTETTKETEGRYFCEADNGVGAALKTALFIKVKQAPKIQPFSFNNKVPIGGRAVGTCAVVTAAAPLTFTWSKDGVQLRDKTGLSIQNNRLVSLLIIETADLSSHGNYTCRASNVIGTDAYTAELKVEAPPTWRHEPQDVSAIVGTNVTVECRATGSPMPQITWTKSKGADLKGTAKEELQVLANGTLLLSSSAPENTGQYSCQASNGIGSPLTKTISLTVKKAPKIQPFQLPSRVKAGDKVSATCNLASGTPPVTFEWLKDGSDVTGLSKDLSYDGNLISNLLSGLMNPGTSRQWKMSRSEFHVPQQAGRNRQSLGHSALL